MGVEARGSVPEKRLAITVEKLAAKLGINKKTLYEYLREHKGLKGVVRMKRRYVIDEETFLWAWRNGELPDSK